MSSRLCHHLQNYRRRCKFVNQTALRDAECLRGYVVIVKRQLLMRRSQKVSKLNRLSRCRDGNGAGMRCVSRCSSGLSDFRMLSDRAVDRENRTTDPGTMPSFPVSLEGK